MELRIKLHDAKEDPPQKTGYYVTVDRPDKGYYDHHNVNEMYWNNELHGWNIIAANRNHELFPKYWGRIEVIGG